MTNSTYPFLPFFDGSTSSLVDLLDETAEAETPKVDALVTSSVLALFFRLEVDSTLS